MFSFFESMMTATYPPALAMFLVFVTNEHSPLSTKKMADYTSSSLSKNSSVKTSVALQPRGFLGLKYKRPLLKFKHQMINKLTIYYPYGILPKLPLTFAIVSFSNLVFKLSGALTMILEEAMYAKQESTIDFIYFL